MRHTYFVVSLCTIAFAAADARAQSIDVRQAGQSSRPAPFLSSSIVLHRLDATKPVQSSRAAPVISSAPPRLDLSAQRLGRSTRAAPIILYAASSFETEAQRMSASARSSPALRRRTPSLGTDTVDSRGAAAFASEVLRSDLNSIKKSGPSALSSRPITHGVDLEALKGQALIPLTASASRGGLDDETLRASGAAIAAIPTQRALDSSGSSVPPIRLTPFGHR